MPWKIALQKIMTTKFKILFFILLIAVLLGGFYYKDNIWGIYNNVGKNLQNFGFIPLDFQNFTLVIDIIQKHIM